VISHADDDHSGGAASVAMSRDPRWMLSPLPAEHPLHDLVQPSLRCEAGEAWDWDGVDFRVLHPPPSIYGGGKRKENDRGCVIRVSTAAHAMLLAADVEARSEAEMLAADRASLASAILLVPHHGSKTSSTPSFVDAVSAHAAIFSVGYRNRFRHPNAMVVARYAERGIELHRTDEEGALRIVLPRDARAQPTIAGQEEVCRYWSVRASCAR
jgi:competence protein ComEC